MLILVSMLALAACGTDLATEPSQADTEPRILFVSNCDGNDEVYAISSDGTNPVNLTNNPAKDARPVWSPDGKNFAFISERDGNRELYVASADAKNPVNISRTTAAENDPWWERRSCSTRIGTARPTTST